MNTKFNKKDVPRWCKWIAIDEDGLCCAYENKPNLAGIVIERKGVWWPTGKISRENISLYRGKPPKNWKDELYTWS